MNDNRTIPVDRRSFLKATGATAAATGLAGCRGSSDSGGFKVGVLAPLSGETSDIGQSMANGAKLAVEEINGEGGIDGSDVEVSVKDTEGDPSTAKQKYQQDLALDEDVDVTTGVFTSEVLMSLMDAIAENETVHLTTGAATPEASQLVSDSYDKYKYHFRTGPLNAVQLGQNVATFALNVFPDIDWNRVYLVMENFDWTRPVQDVIEPKLRDSSDIEVVGADRFSPQQTDYGTLYDRVENADADAALVAMGNTGGQAVTSWSRGQRPFGFGGIHIPGQLPSFYGDTMGAPAYSITQNVATPTSELTDKTQDFIGAYEDKFDSLPIYTGYITYDALWQYATVAGDLDGDPGNADDVITGLEESSYTGAIGTIEYHGEGQRFAHDVIYSQDKVNPVFQQWQPDGNGGGTQEVIYPEDFATADYMKPNWI
ncbi:ABC transporter substrate-binding protein [Halorientalis salina]|uniref:ABC transporter substrate-binding protein n=1 Tax=Halorientalis salina TaxID=2932266 RepID=UPI00145CC106|nr:ABC transporter substrate-binding protein [Halorientalis salina]